MAKKKPDSATTPKPASTPTKDGAVVKKTKKKTPKKNDDLDDIFNNLTASKKAARKAKKSKTKTKTPEKTAAVQEDDDFANVRGAGTSRPTTSDGLKIYTEEELGLNNPLAGTTADCPFDCDCCF